MSYNRQQPFNHDCRDHFLQCIHSMNVTYRDIALLQHEMSNRLQRFSRHFRIALVLVRQQRNDRVVGFGIAILIDVYPMTLNTCSSSLTTSDTRTSNIY